MPAVSYHQLMNAETITRVVATIKTPQSRLQEFFNMGPGGVNINRQGGRYLGWDLFDRTRKIAKGRAPGTGPASSANQPIGHVSAVAYRSHEKQHLPDERVFRTRPMGTPWGTVDENGQRYVAAQAKFLAQKFKNAREFMVSRMLRGGFAVLQSGDDWNPVELAGGTFDIDYQVPAANKSQLNMLGGGDIIGTTWGNIAAPISTNCLNINAAMEQLHGRPLRHCWLNSTTFANVLANTQLINLGGTANTVFQSYERMNPNGGDSLPTGFDVVMRGIPWLTFHVYDAGLDVNGTFTKFFPDKFASFLPDPDSEWAEYIEGSELVRENVASEPVEQFGMHAWGEPVTQPSGTELIGLDNGLPGLYIPKCVTWAQVVFP